MLFVLKIVLVPAIVGLVTIAGRLWGHHISGVLAGLPINLGPILAFLTLERGVHFAESTAESALLGIIAIALFSITYAYCSRSFGMSLTMTLSTTVFFMGCYVLSFVTIPLHLAYFLVITLLAITLVILPNVEMKEIALKAGRVDLYLRMGAAAGVVLLITGFSEIFGPHMSGFLAAFPTGGAVIAGFIHKQQSSAAVCRFFKGYIAGLFGLATFSCSYALFVIAMPMGLAMAGSISAALVIGAIFTKNFAF